MQYKVSTITVGIYIIVQLIVKKQLGKFEKKGAGVGILS